MDTPKSSSRWSHAAHAPTWSRRVGDLQGTRASDPDQLQRWKEFDRRSNSGLWSTDWKSHDSKRPSSPPPCVLNLKFTLQKLAIDKRTTSIGFDALLSSHAIPPGAARPPTLTISTSQISSPLATTATFQCRSEISSHALLHIRIYTAASDALGTHEVQCLWGCGEVFLTDLLKKRDASTTVPISRFAPKEPESVALGSIEVTWIGPDAAPRISTTKVYVPDRKARADVFAQFAADNDAFMDQYDLRQALYPSDKSFTWKSVMTRVPTCLGEVPQLIAFRTMQSAHIDASTADPLICNLMCMYCVMQSISIDTLKSKLSDTAFLFQLLCVLPTLISRLVAFTPDYLGESWTFPFSEEKLSKISVDCEELAVITAVTLRYIRATSKSNHWTSSLKTLLAKYLGLYVIATARQGAPEAIKTSSEKDLHITYVLVHRDYFNWVTQSPSKRQSSDMPSTGMRSAILLESLASTQGAPEAPVPMVLANDEYAVLPAIVNPIITIADGKRYCYIRTMVGLFQVCDAGPNGEDAGDSPCSAVQWVPLSAPLVTEQVSSSFRPEPKGSIGIDLYEFLAGPERKSAQQLRDFWLVSAPRALLVTTKDTSSLSDALVASAANYCRGEFYEYNCISFQPSKVTLTPEFVDAWARSRESPTKMPIKVYFTEYGAAKECSPASLITRINLDLYRAKRTDIRAEVGLKAHYIMDKFPFVWLVSISRRVNRVTEEKTQKSKKTKNALHGCGAAGQVVWNSLTPSAAGLEDPTQPSPVPLPTIHRPIAKPSPFRLSAPRGSLSVLKRVPLRHSPQSNSTSKPSPAKQPGN